VSDASCLGIHMLTPFAKICNMLDDICLLGLQHRTLRSLVKGQR